MVCRAGTTRPTSSSTSAGPRNTAMTSGRPTRPEARPATKNTTSSTTRKPATVPNVLVNLTTASDTVGDMSGAPSSGAGRGPAGDRRAAATRSLDQDGQAASMSLATCAVVWPEANQEVIDFHSCPAPTAAGIRSEASNRNVAFGSVRYFADNASIGSVYTVGSTPELADTQPVATLIRLVAQSDVDR